MFRGNGSYIGCFSTVCTSPQPSTQLAKSNQLDLSGGGTPTPRQPSAAMLPRKSWKLWRLRNALNAPGAAPRRRRCSPPSGAGRHDASWQGGS